MRSRKTLTLLLAIVAPMLLVDVAQAYYTPGLGRFIGRDPYYEPGSLAMRELQGPSVVSVEWRVAISSSGYQFTQTTVTSNVRPIVGHATCGPEGRCEYTLLGSGGLSGEEAGTRLAPEEPNPYEYARNEPIDNIDPFGLSTKCGTRYCMCSDSGGRPVTVYGNSARAKAIIEAGFGKGAQGCVTLLNWFGTGAEIYCTGSCQDIKKWKAGPGVPILDHECCHACDYFDKCVCKYLHGAVKDDCTSRARGGFETW